MNFNNFKHNNNDIIQNIDLSFCFRIIWCAVFLIFFYHINNNYLHAADNNTQEKIRAFDGKKINKKSGDFIWELEYNQQSRFKRAPSAPSNCENTPKPNEPDCNEATADPCILHNGNHFLPFTDLIIPGRNFPLVLTRTYNSTIRSDITGWTSEAGSWLVENKELNGQGDRIITNSTFSDFVIELDMKTIKHGVQEHHVGWINFRYVNLSNMYYFLIRSNSLIEVARIKNGIINTIHYTQSQYSVDDWNHVKISMVQNNLSIYINNNLEVSYDDSNPILSGKIGLNAYWSHVHYDNIDINKGTEFYDFNYTDNAEKSIFGYGWSSNLERNIEELTNGNLIYHMENGVAVDFIKQRDGGFKSPDRISYALVKNESGFEITDKLGITLKFNFNGKIVSLSDLHNNTITYSYNQDGRLERLVDGSGRHITFAYNDDGKIATVAAPLGYIINYEYDLFGHLINVILPGNRVHHYEYDSLTHNLILYDDPNSNRYSYSYYYNDKLSKQKDPEGNETIFHYFWDRTQVTNSNDYTWCYYFNEHRLIVKIENPDGTKRFFKYNIDKNLAESIDEEGNKIIYEYDENGNRTLIKRILRYKTGSEKILEKRIEYDPTTNKPLKVIDEEGNTIVFNYLRGTDLILNKTQFLYDKPITHSFTYNEFGQLLTTTDPLGRVYKLYYEDPMGNLTKVTNPLLKDTTYTYNELGKIISTTDALNRKIEYEYYSDPLIDNSWFLKKETRTMFDGITGNKVSDFTEYIYDLNGNLIEKTNMLGDKTNFTYDKINNLSKVVFKDLGEETENKIIYNYDTTDFLFFDKVKLKSVEDPNGNITSFLYNSRGELIEEKNANGYSTHYEYDNVGDLIKLIDSENNVTLFDYDSLSRLRSITNPLGLTYEYDYDNVGNIISKKKPSGIIIFYQYDTLYRLHKTIYPNNSYVEYEYDDTGNRLSMHDNTGFTLYTYDKMNRILSTNYPNHNVFINYTYDAIGNRTSMTTKEGTTYYHHYNLYNQPQIIVNQLDETTKFVYDKLGRIIKKIFHNGIYAQYDYECDCGTSRPVSINYYSKIKNEVLSSYLYTYDFDGNILTRTSNRGEKEIFKYDNIYQIKEVNYSNGVKVSYSYDKVGNRISENSSVSGYKTFEYDNANRLLSIDDSIYFNYDLDGNLIQKNNGTDIIGYTYDYEDRLNSVSKEMTNYSTHFYPGWNFFSLPGHPIDNSIKNQLDTLKYKLDFDQLSRYNSETKKFEHFVGNQKFNHFNTLEFGKGYQIFVTNPLGIDIQFKNLVTNNKDYLLTSNWNLIGSPVQETTEISSALNNLVYAVDFNQVLRYNRAKVEYEYYQADPELNDFNDFEKGRAYWVKMLKENVWKMKTKQTNLVQYYYNGIGQRVKKSTGDDGSNTFYFYDGPNCIFEKNNSGITTSYYTRTLNIDELISKQTDGVSYYYISDHLGTTKHIVNSDGVISESYEYNIFGEVKNLSQRPLTEHLFTGRRYDKETGLYYYRFRQYDPDIGRFTTNDPIHFLSLWRYSIMAVLNNIDADISSCITCDRNDIPNDFEKTIKNIKNLYNYVQNNPIRYSDPYGLQQCFRSPVYEWVEIKFPIYDGCNRKIGDDTRRILRVFYLIWCLITNNRPGGGNGGDPIYRDNTTKISRPLE